MGKFQIIRTDPAQFKTQIFDFWEKYLPGTPPARFDWLASGNPAGPAVWLFAIDDKNELAGMLSIMPRNIVINGRTMRAGILGDYMIDGKYRVFGPNLQLLKSASSWMADMDFKFLYTVPNAQAEPMIKRVGAEKIGYFKNFVKPLNAKHYLSKYVGPSAQRLISPFVSAGLTMFSRETYILSRGIIEESSVFDGSLDGLWSGIRDQFNAAGDHSTAYLQWKYLSNPLHKFRVLILKDRTSGIPAGLIIFCMHKNRLNIYDVLAKNTESVNELMKGIVRVGKNEGCISVNVEIFDTNPLLPVLKSFGFLDAKNDFGVFYLGEDKWPDNNCYLFGGDRNL